MQFRKHAALRLILLASICSTGFVYANEVSQANGNSMPPPPPPIVEEGKETVRHIKDDGAHIVEIIKGGRRISITVQPSFGEHYEVAPRHPLRKNYGQRTWDIFLF